MRLEDIGGDRKKLKRTDETEDSGVHRKRRRRTEKDKGVRRRLALKRLEKD